MKISRPTINLSINKNVQNVMITPMSYPQANGQSTNVGGSTQQSVNNSTLISGSSQTGVSSLGATASKPTKKRHVSEDNVTQQQQQQRAMMGTIT